MKHIFLVTIFLLTTHSSQPMTDGLKAFNLPEAIEMCVVGISRNDKELLRQGLALKPDINYEMVNGDTKISFLSFACINGNDEIVTELFKEETIDLTKRSMSSNLNLMQLVCQDNRPTVMNLILQKNPELANIRTTEGSLLLHCAAQYNSKDCIEPILSIAPSQINKQDYLGNTPLHYAYKYQQLDCVKTLLINGACITIKNHHQQTPLLTLFGRGPRALYSFFDNDFYNTEKLRDTTDEHGNTQLHLCATIQTRDNEETNQTDEINFALFYTEYIKFLLSLDISRETKNKDGKTAAHLARDAYDDLQNQYKTEKLAYLAKALKHQKIIMDCLAEKNPFDDTTITDDNLLPEPTTTSAEPSHATQMCLDGIKNNNLWEVKISLLGNIDINFMCECKCKAPLLYTACASANDEIVLELLKQKNIDVTVADSVGETPLHQACKRNRPKIVEALLAKNSDVVITKNKNGVTPFDIAMDCGHIECIELLLTANSKHINEQDADGYTTLHKICIAKNINSSKKQYTIIKLLLNDGACTTTQDNLKTTPLIRMFSYLNRENSFYNFITKNPGIAETMIETTDEHKNNQLHLCARLQAFNDKNFQKYLTFLTSHRLNIHSRNAYGKTATDLACDAYNTLYHQYTATNLPYIKKALDLQERLMHAFLRFTPSISCANVKTILQQLPLPQELKSYIAQIYYALNIDTIIARKYECNDKYYDDYIENKNEIISGLFTQPEPNLLWNT